MKIYSLSRKTFLPVPIEEAWQFFSSPDNFNRITPPSMNFRTRTKLDGKEIYKGMHIEYRVSPLFHIPLKWITEIGEVQKPYFFKDTQLKGPYALWEHNHYFRSSGNGTEMRDEVQYALPFGPLGNMAHLLFVKKQLSEIFNFREETLKQIFK